MTGKLPIILSSSSAEFHAPDVELSRGILKSYPETRQRVDILSQGILRDFKQQL